MSKTNLVKELSNIVNLVMDDDPSGLLVLMFGNFSRSIRLEFGCHDLSQRVCSVINESRRRRYASDDVAAKMEGKRLHKER